MRALVSRLLRGLTYSRWGVGKAPELRDAAESEQEEHFSGVLSEGTLEIEGVNGGIHAQGVDGTDFRVHARKHGLAGDLPRVKIEVARNSRQTSVRAVYPRGFLRRCKVKVDFTVEIPFAAAFTAATKNGNIKVTSVFGPVRAATVNGGIQVLSSTQPEARSINGSIEASFASSKWQRPLHFRTVNGAIKIELPRDVNAEVRASTLNGSVTADLPVVAARTKTRNLLDALIGSSMDCGQLLCESLNGSILLSCRK